MLGDSSQHARANFDAVVKGKNIICPAHALQNLVGSARLPFDAPADTQ